jgi:hypothetical protein
MLGLDIWKNSVTLKEYFLVQKKENETNARTTLTYSVAILKWYTFIYILRSSSRFALLQDNSQE